MKYICTCIFEISVVKYVIVIMLVDKRVGQPALLLLSEPEKTTLSGF